MKIGPDTVLGFTATGIMGLVVHEPISRNDLLINYYYFLEQN